MNIWSLVLIFILFFYGGVNFYVGRRIFQCVSSLFPDINGKLYAVIYIFLALSLIMIFLPLPLDIKGIVRWIGWHWAGTLLYLMTLFIVSDFVILFGIIVRIIPRPMPHSIRLYSGLIVLFLSGCLVCYSVFNAYRIKYVSYDIQMKKNILSDEMKIVLISDLHLGEINSENRIESIVWGINKLNPDIVCITGDIFNDNYYALRNPDKAIALFKSIESTYGVYACLGNHDGGNTIAKMIDFLEQSNIKLLKDEYVIIDGRLVLFGRLDAFPIGGYGGYEGLQRKDITETIASLTSLDINLPVVVMDHNPSNIEYYGSDVDLILSGHTHRGQVFPGSLFTKSMFDVDYGHYQKDDDSPHIIVTQGVATWGPPMRIGTNSEIVSIFLR